MKPNTFFPHDFLFIQAPAKEFYQYSLIFSPIHISGLRPRESQPLLPSFKIGRLVQLLDALGVSRHVLGHLGAALVLNQVNRSSSPGDALQAPCPSPSPRRLLQREHVKLRFRCLLDEPVRVAPEALVLVGLKLRLLLLELLLFLPLPSAPSALLSLRRRDGGLASGQTKRLRNDSGHKRSKRFLRYHLCHVEGLQLPLVFCNPLSLQLLSLGEHPVGLFPGLAGFVGFSSRFFLLLLLFLPLV